MTVETPYVFPDNTRGAANGLVQAAKDLFRSRGEPRAARQQHLQDVAVNARQLAATVATRVKEKPIPPLLIALGLGLGLTLLLSRRARGAAMTAGSVALDRYRKTR